MNSVNSEFTVSEFSLILMPVLSVVLVEYSLPSCSKCFLNICNNFESRSTNERLIIFFFNNLLEILKDKAKFKLQILTRLKMSKVQGHF